MDNKTFLISLDIETDTSDLTEEEKAQGYTSRGLDPRITPITEISVSSGYKLSDITGWDSTMVFQGQNEDVMLDNLNQYLSNIASGTLVTWNGSVFDLPFIQDRARMHGVELDLQLTENPEIVPKYDPTPGHRGGYDATWANLDHVDLAYAMKADAEARGVRWSLKPYAKAVLGVEPVEVDRTQLHTLSFEERHAYVASDSKITLGLAREL